MQGEDVFSTQARKELSCQQSDHWRTLCNADGWSLQTLAALTLFSDFNPQEISIRYEAAKKRVLHFTNGPDTTPIKTMSEVIARIQLGVADQYRTASFADIAAKQGAYEFEFYFAAAYYNPHLLDGVDPKTLVPLPSPQAAMAARRIGIAKLERYIDLLKHWRREGDLYLAFWAAWALYLLRQDYGELKAIAARPGAEVFTYPGEMEALFSIQLDKFHAYDWADTQGKAMKDLRDAKQTDRMTAAYQIAINNEKAEFVDVYALATEQLAAMERISGKKVVL